MSQIVDVRPRRPEVPDHLDQIRQVVDVCPPNCITIARADHVGLGNEAQSVLLLDEDLCIRCGLCVNRCPPGALSMVYARELTNG